MRDFIDKQSVDLVMLDPVKKAQSVEENSSDDMDALVTFMADIVIDKNIAFDVTVHSKS